MALWRHVLSISLSIHFELNTMKKIFFVAIILILSYSNNMSAQVFSCVQDMFCFALHHNMENPPFVQYKTYVWEPGDPYYVVLNVPDSCSKKTTFTKKEFPDVHFFSTEKIPYMMRVKAALIGS